MIDEQLGENCPADPGAKDHKFGGDWTEDKLTAVHHYLETYLQVLKNQKFTKYYVDCFAGSGYRNEVLDLDGAKVAEEQVTRYKDGSARKALLCDPGFDRYILVEKDKTRYSSLVELSKEFPAKSVQVMNEDALAVLPRICQRMTGMARCVMFLDPYGMSVDWQTLAAISRTGRVDLWLLVPTGTAVNRLLPQDGKITPGNEKALSRFFGCEKRAWYPALYPETGTQFLFPELFDGEEQERRKVTLQGLVDFYVRRLKIIFPAVAPKPGPLRNSLGIPIFHLFFASASSGKGGGIAVKVANHLLQRLV